MPGRFTSDVPAAPLMASCSVLDHRSNRLQICRTLLFHCSRLACGSQNALPEKPVGINFLSRRDGKRYRHVSKPVLPVTDHHVGFAGHPCMDCRVTEEETEGGISGICWKAADRITWVDILKIDFHPDGFELLLDPVSQENTDVSVPQVARSIAFTRCLHQLLTRAFCYDDARRPAPLEPLSQRRYQTFECEVTLRYQTEVHIRIGEGGIPRDKSRIASHEFDEPNAILGTRSFNIRCIGRPTCLRD